jgi:hypothetical protein
MYEDRPEGGLGSLSKPGKVGGAAIGRGAAMGIGGGGMSWESSLADSGGAGSATGASVGSGTFSMAGPSVTGCEKGGSDMLKGGPAAG